MIKRAFEFIVILPIVVILAVAMYLMEENP